MINNNDNEYEYDNKCNCVELVNNLIIIYGTLY